MGSPAIPGGGLGEAGGRRDGSLTPGGSGWSLRTISALTQRDEKPRVLMAITGGLYSLGGMAAVNRLTMRALAEEGFSLEVLSLVERRSGYNRKHAGADGIRYRAFGFSKARFAAAVSLAAFSGRYDVAIADSINLGVLLVLPALIRRLEFAVWLHGIEVWPPRPNWRARIALRAAAKRIANSSFTRGTVVSRFPGLSVGVCELAIESLPPRPEDARGAGQQPMSHTLVAFDGTQRPFGSALVLHVGRMDSGERNKGQEVLLRAFPTVCQQCPGAQLALVGDGEDGARLRGLAAGLPAALQGRIFMPGAVGDLSRDELFDACAVFAMPSNREGFGLVFLEAMSRGKPCIGGKLDATPCVVVDGATGLLVADPSSPDQVAAALLLLLGDKVLSERLGQAGRSLVESRFLFDHFKARFLKAFMG
jgi:glycosyltransferase involved in cell wall biosynthesis